MLSHLTRSFLVVSPNPSLSSNAATRPYKQVGGGAPGSTQPNWFRRGACTALGLAALPSAYASHTAIHRHSHAVRSHSHVAQILGQGRPWLLPGAKVNGVAPWMADAKASVSDSFDKRGNYDTSRVDWSQIDWSTVDFSQVDWSTINYGASTSTTQTQSSTVQTPTQTAAPQVLQNDQFGRGDNISSSVPQAPASQTSSSQQTTYLAQMTTATSTSSAQTPAGDALQTTTPVAASTPVGNTQIGFGPNSVLIHNNGPQNVFAFFANAGIYQPTFGEPYVNFTLGSGENETVQLPQGWSGRAQKVSGDVADPATWPEMTFNGYMDLTFFDVSYIRGYNGAVLMKATDGSASSGSSVNFFQTASADLETTDSGGNTVLLPTEPYDGSTNEDVVAFLRTMLTSRQGYVVHSDDQATMSTADHNLAIAFS